MSHKLSGGLGSLLSYCFLDNNKKMHLISGGSLTVYPPQQ